MDPDLRKSTLWLHFDDAEVAEVRRRGADLHLRFSAATVRREATPDQAAAVGHAAGLLLTLVEAVDVSLPPALFGRLAGGRLRVEDRWQSRLALPAPIRGAVRLELAFANGGLLEADGRGLEVGFEGPPTVRESFAC